MMWRGETEDQRRERWANNWVLCYACLPTQMVTGEWIWLKHYECTAEPNMRGGYFYTNRLQGDTRVVAGRDRPRPPPPTRTKPLWTGTGKGQP